MYAGTDAAEFSPTQQLGRTIEVVMKNTKTPRANNVSQS
jgi:hypothetical protein